MEKKRRTSQPTPKDLLSSLSDELLHDILFRLPARDAAATCILSRRWLDVWATIPDLNIDDLDFHGGKEIVDCVPHEQHDLFIMFVDRVLIRRKRNAALRTLRLATVFNSGSVDTWVRYAIEHGVQVLELDINEDFSLPMRGPTFTLPSLQKLEIGFDVCSEYSLNWPDSIRLPSLTHLNLGYHTFSTRMVKDIIPKSCPRLQNLKLSWCYDVKILELVNYPFLEELELNRMSGLKKLVVKCVNLRSLTVISGCFSYSSGKRCIYLDVPNLEKFKFDASPFSSCVIAESSISPCLEFASFNMPGLYDFQTTEELTLETENWVDGMGSLLMRLGNAKRLIVNSPWNLVGLSFYLQKNMNMFAEDFVLVNIQHINITYSPGIFLDALYFLLMSSPNLKTLTIISRDISHYTKELDKISKVEMGELHRKQSSSLVNLTEVKFKNFGGKQCEIDLFKLLLRSANELRKVIIQFSNSIPDRERECYMEQIEKLHGRRMLCLLF